LRMGWNLLADLVLLFHAAYVGYVVFGLAAILAGIALDWRWIRNFWFRASHLAAILLVVCESLLGLTCPLTTTENLMRQAAGQHGYAGGCIARWVQPLIFFAYPPWVFVAGYCAFGLVVVAVFVVAPPVRPRGRKSAGAIVAPRSQAHLGGSSAKRE
jgi:hypothetical protein